MSIGVNDNLKQKVVKGVFWRLAERFGTQAMQFVVGIVLARLLGPKAYGTIALLSIFIAISSVFVDCGFGTALIQKKDADDRDFNTVFYLSITVSLIFYSVLFVCAPLIAAFYDEPILVDVLRITAIGLIINAINGVQNAVLARNMRFDLSFRISLVGTFSSGAIGILLAYCGFGIWSLVYCSLGSSIITTVLRWWLIGWRPKFMFSFTALKPLFNFSWKMMASGLLDTFFVNIYGLIIGRVYSATDLALYNKGNAMPRLAMDTVNGTLGSVAFPALAQLQDDRVRLKEGMRKMIQVSTFFVMPAMALMASVAEPFTIFLYGEKWRGAIVFAQIACVSFAFWPFHTINLQGIQAVGRSDVFLKLEIIKKFLCVLSVCVVYKFGVVVFALTGAFVMTPLSVLINSWPNKRLLQYGIKEQLRDVFPTLLISMVVFAITSLIALVDADTQMLRFVLMVVQGIVGLTVFWVLLLIFRPVALVTIMNQFPFVEKMFLFNAKIVSQGAEL